MTGALRPARVLASCLVLLLSTTLMVLAFTPPAGAATATALTRYPYLTDATQTSMTINWATDTSGSSGSVTWGLAGSNCATNTTAAIRTSMTVISKAEYQWKTAVPVSPDTKYCYRVKLGSTDLLGSDPSPQFTSAVKAGSTAPYSFAVFGDWGQAYAGGVNADQTNVLKQISQSGARFAVMTGDTAYPGGGQKEYGDLRQPGTDQSTVFGPTFWTVPGRSIPLFNVTGNHGFTNGAVQIMNFPEQNTAAASNGKYLMENYPSINGSTAKSYPSMWYAFDAGPARYYILTVAWGDSNIGTGSVYKNDRDAHWAPSSAEYRWLQSDLAAHPNALKFAFWHYPLYADSSSQPSDTFLQGGPGTLQGLLDTNNVAMAFNGHAHGYERNKPDAAGLVTHVVGNGGAALGHVSGCSSYDLYAIGSSGSHCGAAPATTNSEVFGFLKVTVNGRTVTVTPTSSTGRTYDVQTYTFAGSEPDSIAPTAPTTLTANPVSSSRVDLSWSGATDNVGVTGYQVYRAVGTGTPVKLADVTGATYSDTTASPSTSYTYSVYALDAAGNRSPAKTATVTTPGADDVTPPSQPGNLQGTATSSSVVNLTWAASTDNVRVAGYKVYRNGTLISQPIVPGDPNPPTAYTDETATAGTTYTYAVSAVDAANNESTKASTTVTTPAGGVTGTFTFASTDDAYVNSSATTTNYGTATRLTVDNSPQTNTLLKFSVAGLPSGCRVTDARLRLTVGNATDDKSPYGGDLYGVADTTWTQSTVTWANQPAAAASKISSVATAVALDTAYDWNATPLITGNGVVSIALKSTNSDGARYYSTEGGTATQDPTLTVTCG
jgi:hypothetical protein